jgi:hypothetical protein
MKERPNQGGGTTFVLAEGDSLDLVPASHREIITNEIRDAFENPRQYFQEIAKRTDIDAFKQFLTKVTSAGEWRLILADTFMMRRETVGAYYWSGPGLYGVMIEPGATEFEPTDCDPRFAPLYSLVRLVQWGEVACGGFLRSPGEQMSLDEYGEFPKSELFAAGKSTVFGSTECGDILVHDQHGLAGMMSHESGRVWRLGTIEDALEWVFAELLAGRPPEMYKEEGESPFSIHLWSPPE